MATKNLITCLAVALGLRLAFIFVGFPGLAERWQLREDGDGYGAIAQTIRAGRYVDVTRGPVYPVFVAVAGSPVTVKVLQALFDVATGLLVYWLAGRRVWAAWLWAVYPFAIWRVAFINKEVVLTLLLTGYAWAQVAALRKNDRRYWVAAGVLLGLVNLCKPSFVLWPVALLIFFLRKAWLTVLAMAVVILPWTIRNWRVTGGEFLPVATERGGVTTFIGNYQPTLGLWEGPGKTNWLSAVSEIERQHAGLSPVELDRLYYRAAWKEVATHSLKAAELVLRKCYRFWFLSAARREQLASAAIQGDYLVLLGIGLWRAWRWSVEVKLLLGLIGYVMVMHASSYADLRFSLPVMPLVCVLATSNQNRRAVDTEKKRDQPTKLRN